MRNGAEGARSAEFALHCIGDVRLYCGETDCTPKSRKARALLAVLAAEKRPLTRVRVIDLLWSNRQEEQARASLRTLLADLREKFGADFERLLVVDRERIALAGGVRTDLHDPALGRPVRELFEGLDHIDPELDDWLRIERGKWDAAALAATYQPAISRPSAARLAVPQWVLALVLLIALVAAALLYLRPGAEPERPMIAVLKFKDLTGKNALLADGLAEELRIQLAQHSTINVISRTSSEDPAVSAHADAVRTKLGARYAIEGALLNRGGIPHVNVRLSDASSGSQLWSQTMPANPVLIREGTDEIALRVASNINETVGQGSGPAFLADASAYEQVFAARKAIWTFDPKEAVRARQMLEPVVARYPRFAPALAVLAEASIYASDHPWYRGTIPLSRARLEAASYARRSIAAAPLFGPGYYALGTAYIETPAALSPLRRAAKLSPGSFETHHRLSRALEMAGDYEGYLDHQRTAAKLDPLGVTTNYMLMRALRWTGRRNEVGPMARQFIARLDDREKQLQFIAGSTDVTGNLSGSYIAARELLRVRPDHEQGRRSLMWTKVYFGDRRGAAALAPSASITQLILRDDLNGLIKKLRSAGTDFWALNWETNDAANYLVGKERSDVLVRLYDVARAASGGAEPRTSVIDSALIIALKEQGRGVEAAKLLRDFIRSTARSGLPAQTLAWNRAEILLFQAKKEEALDQLEFALRDNWLNLQPGLVPLEARVEFRPIRNDPRFRAILRAYYRNVERERRELAAERKRFGQRPIDPIRLI